MSQAGKVLHLYVEVRSVAEEGNKLPGGRDGVDAPSTLQCPDVLPQSQRSSSPDRRAGPSPLAQPQSSSPTKSSSRHSVSFQLQSPDATGSPTQFHRQDLSHDSFSRLLRVLAPGATGPGRRGSVGRTCSSDMDPCRGRMLISPSSTSSGTMTAPSTPTGHRRAYAGPGVGREEGRTSVVTFGYIEKANVRSMGGRHASMCQSELSNPLNRMEGQRLRKRSSDPAWFNGRPGPGDPYYNHPSSGVQSPRSSPYLQRASPDAVPRDATCRALEEFGSPELRRRFAGHHPEDCSPTLPRHHQGPRCRSLGGSPVLPRRTLTLPSKAQLLEQARGACRSSLNGLPRSPASDHLCSHAGYSAHSEAQTSPLGSRGPSHSLQRPWVGEESPRLYSQFHPPLPAGRPTDIQHKIPASIFHTSNHSRTGHQASGNPKPLVDGCYCSTTTDTDPPHSRLYSTSDDVSSKTPCRPAQVSPTYGRRSISPSLTSEVASRSAVEATKLSGVSAERQSPCPAPSHAESLRPESPKMFLRESQPYCPLHERPSPEPLQAELHNLRWKTDKATLQAGPGRVSPLPSQKGSSSPASPASPARLHRPAASSQSPVLDPRHQRGSSPSEDAPALHRYQPPPYTGPRDRTPPGVERQQCDPVLDKPPEESPELSRTLVSCQDTAASPGSWTLRDQQWADAGPVQDGEDLRGDDHRRSTSAVHPSREEHRREAGEDKGTNASAQERQPPVISVSKDEREEVQDHSGAAGTSSQSSSGVTGSMGDSQLDRNDSLSPETSSQSSHDTADTGSGMQVG